MTECSLERNVGLYDHSRLQSAAGGYFFQHRGESGIEVLFAQRVQVSPTRFRLPNVCVIFAECQPKQIFRKPPLICIEIPRKTTASPKCGTR